MAVRTHVGVLAAALVVPAVAQAAPTEEDWAVGVQVGAYESPLVRLPTATIGLHVRRVIVPRISVGLSYALVGSDAYYDKCRSEDCPTRIDVLRAFGELHVLPTSWFDPWVRLGVGADVRRGSNWHSGAPTEARTKFGVDALLGLDLHVPNFSIGPDVRYGVLGFGLGLHAEARF